MIDYAEFIHAGEEAIALHQAYLRANIVAQMCELDALYVALASVADCAIIVSWNFKHIVNCRKIPMYNAINMSLGYKTIAIHSPMEVLVNEEDS